MRARLRKNSSGGLCAALLLVGSAMAQTDPEPAPERWNLYYQATSIGQTHSTFTSPYAGPFSLQNIAEHDVSLTTTLFFGLRLGENTLLYFGPEIHWKCVV